MQLFEFIKILFENKKKYNELYKYEKSRFFFLTNRFMSIQYPGQANMLNHIKIPQSGAVDYWHANMSNIYTKVPNWVFAKGQKKAAAAKVKSKKLPDKSIISKYLQAHKLSHRDLDDAYLMYGDSVYDPIRRMEKVMKQ